MSIHLIPYTHDSVKMPAISPLKVIRSFCDLQEARYLQCFSPKKCATSGLNPAWKLHPMTYNSPMSGGWLWLLSGKEGTLPER